MTTFTDFSEKLASDLRSSGSARGTIGGGVALGEVDGIPPSLAAYVPVQLVDSMDVPFVTATPSGPAGIVAPVGVKAGVVSVSSGIATLEKHAGMARFSMESTLSAKGVEAAIFSVLSSQVVKSAEAAFAAALVAGAGQAATAATWTGALAAAQAKILGAGGRPSVLAISADDYGAVIDTIAGSAGFNTDPGSPIGSWLGSLIHVSSGLAAGTAVVLDASAALILQNTASPLVIIDGLSLADTNEARLVCDYIGILKVSVPPYICTAALVGP